MKRFSRVLCLADLDETAESVLDIAARVASYASARELRILHVVTPIDLPDEVVTRYPWLADPLVSKAEERLAQMTAVLQEKFTGLSINAKVREGSEIMLVLQEAADQDSDLIVAGRRNNQDTRGIRLSRKASCSVMTIPNDFEGDLRPVLVPVDLSDHSRRAIDIGAAFAEAQQETKLHCLHVYSLPAGSHRAVVSEEQLRRDAEEHLIRQLVEFAANSPRHDLEVVPMVASGIPAAVIDRKAAEIKAGLVVAGSRGRDALAALLLGSTAEELLKTSQVPVVTVKEKGAGQNLLQALFQA